MLTDVNECLLGEAMCHNNATCSDVVGGENSYNCTCNPGFTGDGTSCVGEYLPGEYTPNLASVCTLQLMVEWEMARAVLLKQRALAVAILEEEEEEVVIQ